MSDYFDIRDRLRSRYIAPRPATPKGEPLGGAGFLTEVAGRVILTAPAKTLSMASELPEELAQRWEKASHGNPYMMWLQGRFVEAEKANRNGAFWSTEDLQFGEMSVKHGPLNWLHDEKTVIGTIADNALIHPKSDAQTLHEAALKAGWQYDGPADMYGRAGFTFTAEQLGTVFTSDSANGLLDPKVLAALAPQPRPYMAAVSAVWKWVHPDKVQAIEHAANQGRLYYSMECVGREMACVSDETHEGCGKSFDYITAMTTPDKTCAHIAGRTSARRMVDPSFLGGAVIVPPTQPGWGSANVEILRQQASALAEQTHEAAHDMSDSQWEALMAEVVKFAQQ